MENQPLLNEKMVKKTFKNLFKTACPGGNKEMPTPEAAQLVSDTMAQLNREFSVEQATELLSKYDVGGRGLNHKKEITNAVLVAADLDTLDEAEIAEMQAKWQKRQEKIKNSTPEAKAHRKKMKNLFKGHMALKLQEYNPGDSDQISMETAMTLVKEVLSGMEVEVEESEVTEVLGKVDAGGTGVFSEKECKMVVQHLSGMKTIDFVSCEAKRAKRAMKAQKKAMKMKQKQEGAE